MFKKNLIVQSLFVDSKEKALPEQPLHGVNATSPQICAVIVFMLLILWDVCVREDLK